MHDFVVWSERQPIFGSAKGRLVILNGARGIAANKIRGHRAVSFRNGFYLFRHGSLLKGFSGRESPAQKKKPAAISRIVPLLLKPCQHIWIKIFALFTSVAFFKFSPQPYFFPRSVN